MIYDGPIYNELPKLTVPTLLAIGQSDRTVFGRRFAPPEVVKPLGNFPNWARPRRQGFPEPGWSIRHRGPRTAP